MKDLTYERFLMSFPPSSSADDGEVEIRPLQLAGPAQGPLGIVYQDNNLAVIRDPVLFPNLTEGVCTRLVLGEQKVNSASVLPLKLGGGHMEIGWIRRWRHPLQGHCTEIPRDRVDADEDPGAVINRTLREKLGLGAPDLLVYLGDLADDPALMTSYTAMFVAAYVRDVALTLRASESRDAISDVFWAPMQEWTRLSYETPRAGRPATGPDAFTAAALGLAFATGTFDSVNRAATTLFSGSLTRNEKLASSLQQSLSAGLTEFDVRVNCSSPAAAERLLRTFPARFAEPVHENFFRIRYTSPLLISWLVQQDDVQYIEPR